MVKKRYARKKRFYKKRRYLKRKYRKQGYDGVIKVKVHGIYDIAYNSTYTHGDLTINWAGNGAAVLTNTARLTVTNEFTTWYNLYNEYSVVGVKIRVIPINTVTGTTGSGLYHGVMGSDTSNALPNSQIPENQLYSYVDFKEFTLEKPVKKYINLGKYFRKQGIQWQKVTANYPDAGTLVRLYCMGYANNSVMAKCHVTWYVKFKGPQL